MTVKLHPLLTVDFPRKFASLICAGAICYSVHRQIQEDEIFRDIPVTIEHPKDLVIVQRDFPKINVKVQGPKRRVKSLTNTDIKITGEISEGASAGRNTVILREKNVKIPRRNIQILDISPNSLHVYVDKVETVQGVPIRCRFTGQLPEGYGRKSFLVVPKTVQATGPSKIIREIKELATDSIELDENIHEDFEVEVPLLKMPQVSVTPERVKSYSRTL